MFFEGKIPPLTIPPENPEVSGGYYGGAEQREASTVKALFPSETTKEISIEILGIRSKCNERRNAKTLEQSDNGRHEYLSC